MYEIVITNTTVEPFHGTTTRGSGLMIELKMQSYNNLFLNQRNLSVSRNYGFTPSGSSYKILFII
jgi:hypothetical protein